MIIKEERTVDIDYKILAQYHVNAEMIWEVRKEKNQSPKTLYNFFRIYDFDHLNEIEECKQESQEIYEMLVKALDSYKISEHHGNLFYIIINHLELEGSLLKDHSRFIEWAELKLIPLLGLLKIRDNGLSNNIRIEFTHKSLPNKNFPEYTMVNDRSTIDKLIDIGITTMFQDIKKESEEVNPMLSIILEDITTPTYSNIHNLVGDLSAITKRTFNASFLYTIASEVERYLTNETDMNPEGADITNNQARVVYLLLVYFDLINKENHEINLDIIGYIRSIHGNKKETKTLLKSTIDQGGTDLLNTKIAKHKI